MADTGTCAVTATDVPGGRMRIRFSWTSTAGGVVEKTYTLPPGAAWMRVLQVETNPDDTDAPTDQYDITIEDSQGADVLQTHGANRSNANTELYVFGGANAPPTFLSGDTSAPIVVFKVAAAGASKKGVCDLIVGL